MIDRLYACLNNNNIISRVSAGIPGYSSVSIIETVYIDIYTYILRPLNLLSTTYFILKFLLK